MDPRRTVPAKNLRSLVRETDAGDRGQISPRDEPESDRCGQLMADRYRLIRIIGEGGMGTVYRAEHVELGKPLAVKVLHSKLSHHPTRASRPPGPVTTPGTSAGSGRG